MDKKEENILLIKGTFFDLFHLIHFYKDLLKKLAFKFYSSKEEEPIEKKIDLEHLEILKNLGRKINSSTEWLIINRKKVWDYELAQKQRRISFAIASKR